MNEIPNSKVIHTDEYDLSVNNNELNTDFPLSYLDINSNLIPGVKKINEENDITFDDIDIEEVYDSVYNITLTKNERNELDIMRNVAEENLPEVDIDSIEFSIIKRSELINYSIPISSSDKEGPGSINDPRLGVVKGNNICGTCHRMIQYCPGHLGRIELAKPIINPFYKRDVIRLLNIFCNTCGASLLTKEQIADLERLKYAKTRMHLIEQHVKSIKNIKHSHRKDIRSECEGIEVGKLLQCVPNPKYDLDKVGHKIEYKVDIEDEGSDDELDDKRRSGSDDESDDKQKKGKKSKKHERTIEDIIKIFKLISSEDAKMIGLGNNMPIDFIMFDIIVTPPKLRGASHKETKNESDRMADIYISIIKANNRLKSGKLSYKDQDTNIKIIYDNIKMLIESKEPKSFRGTKQVSARKLLQGKEGIFRQYLMSKRADFTARSVIGPDPDIDFGYISVPKEWAEKLTVNERIFQANLAYMNKLLQKGRITNVTKGSGTFKGKLLKVMEKNRDNIKLEIGDKVDRWLQEGDYLTLNRMPSLHKQSMMSVRVKLWDNRTIGLHLSYTTPFNADFDGDEMNLHSFQIVEAIAEAASIVNVEMCIPNEQSNSPIMGLVMDNVVGAYLLTYLDDIVDEDTWNDCLIRISTREDLATLDKRLFEQGIKKYTGKALFSALLPEELYYQKGDVLIVNGILKTGAITKDHVGVSPGSIIQAIYNNPEIIIKKKEFNDDTSAGLGRGLRRASLFIRDAYHVLNRWLTEHGFTLSAADCIIDNPVLSEMKKTELTKLRMLVNQLGGGTFVTEQERKNAETQINEHINNFKNIMGKNLIDNIDKDNNFNIMISSGAKGKNINLEQMSLLVGQQMYFGERMKLSISNNKRVLPHFDVGEDSLSSGGMIERSYMEGLTPIEYFYAGASARQGLIASAMSIAEIGEIRRNMFKMLEDCKSLPDATVRDSNNRVIEDIYGSDGNSGAKLFSIIENKNTPNKDPLMVVTDIHSLANQLNAKHGY